MNNRLGHWAIMLFFVLMTCMQGCNKAFDMKISNAHDSSIPQSVQLLDHTSKTLTIAWNYVPEATSYTVQLVSSASSEEQIPLYSYNTNTEDYYIFSNLDSRATYYARVRGNFPNSATSAWVYVQLNNETAKLIPLYGVVAADFEIPYFKIIDSSSSTITAEWSFTGFDNPDTETADNFSLYLYEDAEAKKLVISWEDLTGLFAPSTDASPKPMRFTFSGLSPDKRYFLKVKDNTQSLVSGVKEISTTPALAPVSANPGKTGDIVLAQDFSKFIHGGDIFFKAAGYTVGTAAGRADWQPAAGANPVSDELGQATCNLNTEFNVFDGGNVTKEYTIGVGMENWGKVGNTSTKPGYIKIGGNKGLGALYTPELSHLAAASSITINFKAGVYMEVNQAYCDRILVQAIEGAVFDAKGNLTNSNDVHIVASSVVDIHDALDHFKKCMVNFDNISKNARIVFSSDPDDIATNKTRFVLDDILVSIK